MKDETEVLLRLCEESWAQVRHLEDQRATYTNLVIVVAAGVLGFVIPQGLTVELFPLTILLFVMGVVGAIATWKFYERYQWHNSQADKWLERIDSVLVPNAGLGILEKAAKREHQSRYKGIVRIRVHWLWIALHGLIALLGLILTLLILF